MPFGTIILYLNFIILKAEMISKKVISEIKQLHQLKFRQQTGLFIAEGEKVVDELLASDLSVKQIICLKEYADNKISKDQLSDVTIVDESELARISLLKSPNKVLVVASIPFNDQITIADSGIYLVLDGIRDPGNMGTIIRTAAWFGVKGVICSDDCVDVYNPKVVQGAMGALFHTAVYSASLPEYLADVSLKKEVNIIAADLKGTPLGSMQLNGTLHFVIIGNESTGIRSEVGAFTNHRVRIHGGGTESLNAAVACGIILNTLYK